MRMVQRIAYEIYEHHFEADFLVFAGIQGQGFRFCQLLVESFGQIAGSKSALLQVCLNKQNPLASPIDIEGDISLISRHPVVLVDDVLNTGKTLCYSLHPFLQAGAESLKVAVLVDRGYHQYPVAAHFTGYELATTVNQHIHVSLDPNERFGVYLY